MFDRRDFLAKLTALGVAGLVGGTESGSGPPQDTRGRDPLLLDRFTAATFAGLVGQTFRIEYESGDWLEAELMRVESRCSSRRFTGRQPFSLIFRLHGTEAVSHQTYAVEHPDLGRFPLFLGAVGKPTAEVHLEAVFA